MQELDDVIKHFGKKGMKWGVRKSGGSKGQNGNKPPKEPGALKKQLNSVSRERQWKKTLKNVNNMSTKDINKTVSRIQMENDLKKLSRKKKRGSSKDRQDYVNRAKMTDQELSRKVNRLRAKENLNRTVKEASKGQREFGKLIVKMIIDESSRS